MSDYRRLISYIYAYEGGEKGKNIGFAKIDMRGPQCRIQVNVKKVYVGSSDVGVYLLHAGGELLLGRIFIRGGAGEFRTQIQSENVDGSGLRVDDCYGLTIHELENAWQSYTTIWEDAVAQTAEIQLAEVTAENLRKQKEDQELTVSAEIERELEAEEQKLEATAPWGEENENVDKDSSEPVMQQETLQEEPKSLEQSLEQSQQAPKEQQSQPRGPEDTARLAELDREENEELADTNIWKKMSDLYTKVLAFDYDNGCEILSIKPQDIGLLPREVWTYGNNSFLLHGYYNYRHLILGRIRQKDAWQYYIGVPGNFYDREKMVAEMFGFEAFEGEKESASPGDYGYYMKRVEI